MENRYLYQLEQIAIYFYKYFYKILQKTDGITFI